MQIPTAGPFSGLWLGVTIVGMIPAILLTILLIRNSATSIGRERTLPLIGLLLCIFFLIRQLALLVPLGAFLEWFWMIHFAALGICLFFVLMYVAYLAFPELLSRRRWVVVVALIGMIAYELAAFIDGGVFASSMNFFIPEVDYTGVEISYVPQMFLVIALVYLTIYLVFVPLYTLYRYSRLERIRGSPKVKWMWVGLLGLLLWFIADVLIWGGWLIRSLGEWPTSYVAAEDLGLSLFTGNVEALIPAILTAIGWYLILFGIVLFGRSTSESVTSEL